MHAKNAFAVAALLAALAGPVLADNYSFTDLAGLGGNSAAHDINALSQIAGVSQLAGNSTQHAFLWSAGSVSELGTLGGS